MRRPGQKGSTSVLILIVNIVLLVSAILLYGRYTAVYQERLREENLGNIANLNQSASINASALVNSWDIKLEDVRQYIERNGLDHAQTLEYLVNANSSAERQFELIGRDGKGFLVRRAPQGGFIPISYQGSTYADLQKIFAVRSNAQERDVRFAPEFTDQYTALKQFALYTYLPLRDAQGVEDTYTLLLGTRSSDVLAVFNSQTGFEGLSTVLVDAQGNYIVSSTDFKSDNFFQYLYVYNDLTLDQQSAVQQQMNASDQGELYYLNSMGLPCVFRYVKMSTNDWYCITCVPLSSFRTSAFSTNYAIYAVAALILMLGIDMLWLRSLNRRMRVSMFREKEAGEAKTDFLSRMSHDIRTPLNGVIGMTLLAMDEPNPPRTAEYLDHIKSSGEFLLGLVNDILDISKVESGKMEIRPERYECREFCRYINAIIAPLCREKGLTFRMTEDDRWAVMLDRLRFNQIFFNLLSNAVKYTPAGGQVELLWEQTPLENDRVALEFIVRDNGAGMSETFQQHMFEAFAQERRDPNIPGSGLGLTIVHNLVCLMDGQIRVESKLGEGTTFHVRLEAARAQAPDKAYVEPDAGTLQGRRMLLCEDNQMNVIIAQRLLEKWGVTVELARNGRQGVEMFAASAPGAYDTVLMDIRMPEMDGLEATRAIRALPRADAAAVPIIAMTANAYDSDVANCLEAGMNAHLGKPIQPELLREVLITHLTARA